MSSITFLNSRLLNYCGTMAHKTHRAGRWVQAYRRQHGIVVKPHQPQPKKSPKFIPMARGMYTEKEFKRFMELYEAGVPMPQPAPKPLWNKADLLKWIKNRKYTIDDVGPYLWEQAGLMPPAKKEARKHFVVKGDEEVTPRVFANNTLDGHPRTGPMRRVDYGPSKSGPLDKGVATLQRMERVKTGVAMDTLAEHLQVELVSRGITVSKKHLLNETEKLIAGMQRFEKVQPASLPPEDLEGRLLPQLIKIFEKNRK